MSNSRKALRNFYNLSSDSINETSSDIGSEIASEPEPQSASLLVDEEEKLTEFTELDEEYADIHGFVSKIREEQNLHRLLATYVQIFQERAALANSQRELVNDNYKRLIHAAEALKYLNNRGDLAEVSSICDTVNQIANWASKIS